MVSTKPSRTSTTNNQARFTTIGTILHEATNLSVKAAELEETNQYEAALETYMKSAVMLSGILDKKAPQNQVHKTELERRLRIMVSSFFRADFLEYTSLTCLCRCPRSARLPLGV